MLKILLALVERIIIGKFSDEQKEKALKGLAIIAEAAAEGAARGAANELRK